MRRPQAEELEKASPAHVDAVLFMAINAGLRSAFQLLEDAPLTDGQRARWQRRLIAISTQAHEDLEAAGQQLDRYERDWAREASR